MIPEALYEVRCPNGHTTEMPETFVEGIILDLQGAYATEPVLNFVCSECKTAFHFDYQNMEPVRWTDAPRRMSEFQIASVQVSCDGKNCDDHVVLTALRNRDIQLEAIHEESKAWNVSGVSCKSGYPASPIGTAKHSRFQYFAGGF